MLFQSWSYQLLGLFPQSLFLVALGTALIREKSSYFDIFKTGLAIGLVGFVVAQLPMEHGVHVPIGIMTFIILMCLMLRINIARSAVAALLSFLILSVLELTTAHIQIKCLHIPEGLFMSGSDPVRFCLALPTLIGLFLVTALVRYCRFYRRGKK